MRSQKESICGEVNKPVRNPTCYKAFAVFIATEPFPLVPAMWIEGNAVSGFPNSYDRRDMEFRVSSARTCLGADPSGPLCLKTF